MSREEFLNYLDHVVKDIESLEGSEMEIKHYLIDIAHGVLETLDCHLNSEEEE